MKKSINLITQGKKNATKIYRKTYYASAGIFIFVILLGLVLLTVRLSLVAIYDNLDKTDQELVAELISLQVKRDKIFEVKDRLANIDKILAKRAPTTSRLATVTELIPINSNVTSLSGSKETLLLTLETDKLSDLDNLMEKKIQEITRDKTKIIKTVEMKSFTLNPASLLYTITIELTFG